MKMDIVGCRVMLGGDPNNIVVRDEYTPVSWPEVGLIAMMHGVDSVYEFRKISEVETDPATEKRRLTTKYPPEEVERFAPGYNPQFIMQMPAGFVEELPEGDLSRRERAALRRNRLAQQEVMDLPTPASTPTPAGPAAEAAAVTAALARNTKTAPAKPGDFSKNERYREEL